MMSAVAVMALMKITVEINDHLHRKAKSLAAARGCALKDLIEEGLRRVVEGRLQTRSLQARSLAELMKSARGTVVSGIPDLASNPRHLAGLGRTQVQMRRPPRKRP
jgi:hypothetical protein